MVVQFHPRGASPPPPATRARARRQLAAALAAPLVPQLLPGPRAQVLVAAAGPPALPEGPQVPAVLALTLALAVLAPLQQLGVEAVHSDAYHAPAETPEQAEAAELPPGSLLALVSAEMREANVAHLSHEQAKHVACLLSRLALAAGPVARGQGRALVVVQVPRAVVALVTDGAAPRVSRWVPHHLLHPAAAGATLLALARAGDAGTR